MTATRSKLIKCPDCGGTEELETLQQDTETGCYSTVSCPHCDGGKIEVEDDSCHDCGSELACNCGYDDGPDYMSAYKESING